MLNKSIVIGRLVRDPDIRSTGKGIPVASFTIACERDFKNAQGEKEVDFLNIVVWRGLAETCGRYLAKGKLVAVEGRLQIRTYEANDGSKRTIAEIVADNVQFLTPKGESAGSDKGYYPDEPVGEEITPLDDIPF